MIRFDTPLFKVSDIQKRLTNPEMTNLHVNIGGVFMIVISLDISPM